VLTTEGERREIDYRHFHDIEDERREDLRREG